MTKTEKILVTMTNLLNPVKARRANVTYAFRFSGAEGGEFTLSVADGDCTLVHGIVRDATTLVECSDQIWISIAEKRLAPWQALLRKEITVTGSRLAMMRFGGLFSGDPKAADVPDFLFKETSNERDFKRGVKRKTEKVLVIQASPRNRAGATEIMLKELVAGLEGAGASVDSVYLAEADIKNCTGCYTCWKHTDGVCVHQDAMSVLLPRIPEYDLLVLATPLYTDSIPGKLKSFHDRCIPLFHPYIFNKAGRCRHPSRYAKLPNTVLLSVCGFYEVENFDNLVRWLEDEAENSHMPLVGALLRPHAHILFGDLRFAAIDRVLEAARQAGRELAETGRVSGKTQAAVSKPLVPRPIFMAAGKNWWNIET
jgi:putative sterol carrier protein/FMN-dependent NADH-azoreductase